MQLSIKNMVNRWDKKISEKHPKFRQWFWFIALWLLGFLTLTVIATFIKSIFWLGGAQV